MPTTPGPWNIHRDGRGRGYEINAHPPQRVPSDLSNCREVCRINAARRGAGRGCLVRWYEHPHDAANARLIAAAPDMLDLLHKVFPILRPLQQAGNDLADNLAAEINDVLEKIDGKEAGHGLEPKP